MPNAVGGPGAAGEVVLPVRLKRRHRAQAASAALQDGPAALTLLAAGAAGVRAPRGTVDLLLALAELAVAGLVLRFLARGVAEAFGRAAVRPPDGAPAEGAGHAPGRVRWEGVAAGLLAVVEAWHHWHVTGRVKGPTLLTGVVTLALAVGGAAAIERRFESRRPRLAVSRDGVFYRASRWRRFAAGWDEVERVEHGPGALRLALRGGRDWTLRADEHLDGAALVRAAREAVAACAPARLTARRADGPPGGASRS